MPLSSEQTVVSALRKMTDAGMPSKNGPAMPRQTAAPRSFLTSLLWSLAALSA
jgi:hypothetical protein